MKREVIIAIIVGFLFGGIAAVTITNLPVILKYSSIPKESELLTPTPAISPINQPDFKIEIFSPKDQSVIDEETVEISGKGRPETAFLIETDNEMKTTLSDKEGVFKEKIYLSDGQNNIFISSIIDNSESESYNLTIYYTSEKL